MLKVGGHEEISVRLYYQEMPEEVILGNKVKLGKGKVKFSLFSKSSSLNQSEVRQGSKGNICDKVIIEIKPCKTIEKL